MMLQPSSLSPWFHRDNNKKKSEEAQMSLRFLFCKRKV